VDCTVCLGKVSNPGAVRVRGANSNEAAPMTDNTAQKINTSQHGAEGTKTHPIQAPRYPTVRLTLLYCSQQAPESVSQEEPYLLHFGTLVRLFLMPATVEYSIGLQMNYLGAL
jgi:hypothetical protein